MGANGLPRGLVASSVTVVARSPSGDATRHIVARQSFVQYVFRMMNFWLPLGAAGEHAGQQGPLGEEEDDQHRQDREQGGQGEFRAQDLVFGTRRGVEDRGSAEQVAESYLGRVLLA